MGKACHCFVVKKIEVSLILRGVKVQFIAAKRGRILFFIEVFYDSLSDPLAFSSVVCNLFNLFCHIVLLEISGIFNSTDHAVIPLNFTYYSLMKGQIGPILSTKNG